MSRWACREKGVIEQFRIEHGPGRRGRSGRSLSGPGAGHGRGAGGAGYVLGGLKEPPCQFVALLARGLEAGPALLEVASGAGGELTDVVLALADDLRDLRVVVVEHVVKQQDRALLGREALEQHQHGQRQRVGRLSVPGRIIVAVGDDRLWQPLAHVRLATDARGT
jgi:hypothetical protein